MAKAEFENLDKVIKFKINNKNQFNKNVNFNPLYISNEEVNALLDLNKDEYIDIINRFDILCKLFNLDKNEKDILLTVFAQVIDPKYERIFAYLQDDLNKKYPTISLVSSFISVDEEERIKLLSYFTPQSPLFLFQLIELVKVDENNSTYDYPLKVTDSVRTFLLDFYSLNDKIQPFCSLVSPIADKKVNFINKTTILNIQKGIEEQLRFIINIYGKTNSEKQNIALDIASTFGYGLLKVDTKLALEYFDSIEELFHILYRESILAGTLIYFDNFDIFLTHEKYHIYEPILFNQLNIFSYLTFFSSTKIWKSSTVPANHIFLDLPLKVHSHDDRVNIWKQYLQHVDKAITDETCQDLTQLFKFTADDVKEIAHTLYTKKYFDQVIDKKTIYDVCREKVSLDLKNLAQSVDSENKLEDIVLPVEEYAQLKMILSHYKNQYKVFEQWGFKKQYQSQGLGVLFTGSPGTGKTMGASIMANELGLDLYRIELSQVVSKYIGETEKNLSKIFEAAEGSGVILFFDEADAIFGKRTEIKDSHDRYANIEVSYLLQKIEEYDGLVILASNFRKNIDEAFVRRMRFIINFPFPDKDMRERIWKKIFPKQSPFETAKIDFSLLAQNFALSGANIRNAALFAAFYAAKDFEENQNANQMQYIVDGLKIELTKIGKSFKSSDFNPLLVNI